MIPLHTTRTSPSFCDHRSSPASTSAVINEKCRPRRRVKDEASYVCESCGEEIVVSIDLSAGSARSRLMTKRRDRQGDQRQLCASIRRSFSCLCDSC